MRSKTKSQRQIIHPRWLHEPAHFAVESCLWCGGPVCLVARSEISPDPWFLFRPEWDYIWRCMKTETSLWSQQLQRVKWQHLPSPPRLIRISSEFRCRSTPALIFFCFVLNGRDHELEAGLCTFFDCAAVFTSKQMLTFQLDCVFDEILNYMTGQRSACGTYNHSNWSELPLK